MAKRIIRTQLTDNWKEKIRAANIVHRLDRCANGEIKMEACQLKAADILLKKVAPDLSRSDVNNNHTGGITVTANVKIT